MATVKVTALAETTSPQAADVLLISQSGVSKKVQITNLPASTPGTGSISTAMLADDAVTTDKLANAINSAITANTAKTSNVTHTGDVTGATELTIASGAVETGMIADDAVTAAKLANSINAEITANTAKTTNATHTGDVTGATTLTIGNDKVITAKILDDNVTAAKLANSINTDIATGVTANTTANAALPKAGGTMTGALVGTTAAFSTADNTDTLTLTSTDDDANAAPNVRLYRNSGSPADGDTLGKIEFEGRNDNSQDVVYAGMYVRARDVSDGAEDASLDFTIMSEGTERSYMKWYSNADSSSQEIAFNDDSQDVNFRVESNGLTSAFFVDGGTGTVTVGANAVGTMTTDNDGSFAMSASNNFKCTPAGNFALTFTSIVAQSGNILFINSGGHTISAHANTKVDANLLATISTAGTYLLSYFSDGTNVYMTNSAVYT